MNHKKYTQEHIEYLRKIAPGRYNDEIRDMFNKKFKMNVTKSAIQTLKVRNNIQSGVSKQKPQFTKEHLDYLRELCKQGLFNKEITGKFNKKFNQNRSESSIRNIRAKHKIYTTARNRWKKGHIPWNKGLKGIDIGGKETRFKKGNIPPNYKPVGSERINSEGYTEVKIADPNIWKGKHVLIWEQHHGPVPEGYCVIFGDGNKRNFDINNLILVSRKQLLKLNQLKLIKNDADLTRTGVMIVDIYNKISERKN